MFDPGLFFMPGRVMDEFERVGLIEPLIPSRIGPTADAAKPSFADATRQPAFEAVLMGHQKCRPA